MRIVQLIDSLEAGGAERMAVHYANVLSNVIDYSGLVVSRKEGMLSSQVINRTNYLFLNRTKTFDIKAVNQFKAFVIRNNVEIVHAHGTSFFLAVLLKIVYPKIKIVYHEHYGNRVNQSLRQYVPLYFCSIFFSLVFVVNRELEVWAKKRLLTKKVAYISNFPIFEKVENELTILRGINQKRIVCLANLKKPKNHQFLIKIAVKLKKSHSDWSFHLIGKVYDDAYSKDIAMQIEANDLKDNVFIYDIRKDIQNILDQATIAILTSESEGLPVALLEYGLSSKAVIATAVGEIPAIIENNINGILVESNNTDQFYDSIVHLINNEQLISIFGKKLNNTVASKFDSKNIIKTYLDWLTKI